MKRLFLKKKLQMQALCFGLCVSSVALFQSCKQYDQDNLSCVIGVSLLSLPFFGSMAVISLMYQRAAASVISIKQHQGEGNHE